MASRLTFFYILTWITCGLIAAGGLNASLGRNYCLKPSPTTFCWSFCYSDDRRRDLGFSISMGLVGGPVSLVVATIVTGVFSSGWSLNDECPHRTGM